MSKVWRVVVLIVLFALLFGAVCIGIGLFTGADTARIMSVLDNSFHIEQYTVYVQQLVQAVASVF